jgi:hypothetical protein
VFNACDPHDLWVEWITLKSRTANAGGRPIKNSEIELHRALVLLRRARRVRRNVRRRVARLDNLIVDQVLLDFVAAHIREHVPVDFNTGRKRLSAFRFHLPAKRGILDDVLLRVGEIVFGQNCAHTGAPAAISL